MKKGNIAVENQDSVDRDYILSCRILEMLLQDRPRRLLYFREYINDFFSVQNIHSISRANNCIMRVLEAIYESKESIILLKWEEIFQEEKRRCAKTVALISEITKRLDREGIGYVVIKTLDSYPDCGNDVDVFVDAPFKETKDWVEKTYNGKMRSRKISEVICGKMSVCIHGYPVLELHCRMIGQVGEQAMLARKLTKNRRLFEINGIRAYVPSKEEQIIIIAIHRLYRHLSFKISDIVNAIKLLKEADFNWEYLFKLSEDCGMSKGVAYLLGILENIHIAYFENGFIPGKYKSLIDKGVRLSFRHWFFRIPLFKVPAKLYASEAFYFLKRGRVGSVARLSLIPALSLIAYVSIKIFKDDWVW